MSAGGSVRVERLARVSRRLVVATAVVTGVLVLGAGSASAHVQVHPLVAAPNDPIEVDVLVPNEQDATTTKVDVHVPTGVLVFSIADVPGWTRTTKPAADGSIGDILYTGKLAQDGYAHFTFLASTPATTGTLEWKALQTYSDGSVVRWIGDPSSDNPAATMRIEASAPRQNAGGEGAAEASSGSGTASGAGDAASSGAGGAATTAVADTATGTPAKRTVVHEPGDDSTARWLAVVAIVVGVGSVGAHLLLARSSRKAS